MGGLIVQLLVNRGLGARGVAIDSAPPKGVTVLRWSMLRSNFPILFGSAPVLLTEKQWRYAFDNTSTPEEAHAHYEKQLVPESKLVGRGALGAKIDWERAHAPLLLIAGGAYIIPPVNRQFRKYSTASKRDQNLFDGRTLHTILDRQGWRRSRLRRRLAADD
jgi:hypothetical protein